MWRPRKDSDDRAETCIACGAAVTRSEAREYDKEGDRWERHGKEFEYLCKPCYRDLCHQPRDELEDLLVEIGAGTHDSRASFLEWYATAVEEKYGTLEEEQ